MKGPIHFTYDRLNDSSFDEVIEQCRPADAAGVKAVLKLQIGAFATMGALSAYGVVEANPVVLDSTSTVSKLIGATLTTGIIAPWALAGVTFGWGALECAVAYKKLSKQVRE